MDVGKDHISPTQREKEQNIDSLKYLEGRGDSFVKKEGIRHDNVW